MQVESLAIPEVKLIKPRVFGDERGFFLETFSSERYAEHGIDLPFVQDNLSYSRKGILRGLHLQNPHAQGKLVSCVKGAVFDVAADIRAGSPTFGKWVGATLTAEGHEQLWVPPGFAHGFLVLSEDALFSYKCTDGYHPSCEMSVAWNDPTLAIDWPLEGEPTLSEKDAAAPKLGDIPEASLPKVSS